MNKNIKFIGVALGIFTCYFYYGILQETITRGKYANNEKFTYTLSLVFIQCIVNYLYSLIILRISPPAGTPKGQNDFPRALCGVCSLTYLLAMITSNMSLQWVAYPTQVVAKSCKPIPVMVLGVLVGGKSYALRKYLFVLMIVIGVSMFMYNPKKAAEGAGGGDGIGVGELLLIMSLAMDGLTGAVQERMRAGPVKLNSGVLMKYMNLYSVGYVLIALLLTQEIFAFPAFVSRHPSVLPNIMVFSLASALGQFFIFVMVTDFGPLPCSIVTTTRKFFTVLASVFIFGNVLTDRQWLGSAVVFAGLTLDSVYR